MPAVAMARVSSVAATQQVEIGVGGRRQKVLTKPPSVARLPGANSGRIKKFGDLQQGRNTTAEHQRRG
ncbi:MAG: hypothetical protein R3E34_15985 [Rhodocyclaceae bacterium]